MHNKWLISRDVQRAMGDLLAAGRAPTAEQQAKFREEARDRRSKSPAPENYSVVDGVAIIEIFGLLTQEPDFWSWLLDEPNTLYGDIAEAVQRAESDPAVRSIQYHVSSPGGLVSGLEIARNAIDLSKKPRVVYASQATSAAYWLGVRAARGGEFIATSPMASFGSIGVAITLPDMKARGYVQVTSTDAPNKRPDVSTEEGVKAVQEELDEIHDHFANDVASARGVSREKVNADFGRGGVMLAERALKAGMIDAVQPRPAPARVSSPAASTTTPVVAGETQDGKPVNNQPQPGLKTEGKKMDAEKLKSEHPDLFAKVQKMGFDAGFEAGVSNERERVQSHLTLADGSGDVDYALKCIKDGAAISSIVHAQHMASTMKRAALGARAEDNTQVEKATSGSTPKEPEAEAKPSAELDEERLVALMDESFGKGV